MSLKSWVESANNSVTDFPIQNLPYGVFFRSKDAGSSAHIGVAIGDFVLDLNPLQDLIRSLLPEDSSFKDHVSSFGHPTLNSFMSLPRSAWKDARSVITRLLSADEPALRDNEELKAASLVAQSDVHMQLPCAIGDYTDFYSSREHATNVGTMFRGPENALKPNWLHLPVGYHGRSSSVVTSGADIARPYGQTKAPDAPPAFTPCNKMDFELEMGAFVGGPTNKLGERVSIAEAEDRIFGFVLLNDWSARDIQKWEYVPLGPFTAKNFATTISPWIVTVEALEPFKMKGPDQSEPPVLPYLRDDSPAAYDVNLQVLLTPEGHEPEVISTSHFGKYMYWSPKQQLVHHSVTGCPMVAGDLLGSGTISGTTPDSYGSMLELCWNQTKPIALKCGQERKFLLDGDTVTLKGWCQGEGYRIGFGECSGKVLPARDPAEGSS